MFHKLLIIMGASRGASQASGPPPGALGEGGYKFKKEANMLLTENLKY
jgi:hypothetical protein